ncbi:LCP family protein [Enterococcus hirae]|nr:LCP family protein [Enterococcus hirae]
MKRFFRIFFILILLLTLCGILFLSKVYFDTKSTFNDTYNPIYRERQVKQDINKTKPISVLLLGTDTGDLGRNDVGRTDTIVVAILNPKKERTTLVSIPRDTYTEIYNKGINDKINHAYAYGGVSMTLPTVENLLNISIDYYIETNLLGIKKIIDIIGDIDVNNKFSFNYEGTYFPIGKIKLNGEEALKYSRMRYDDPDGDYGRQSRQREVLTGIINKLNNVNNIFEYKNILNVVGSNLKTDLSWNEIKKIVPNYDKALKNIDSDQLRGENFIGNGEVGEQGISYQKINGEELKRIQEKLKKQLS